MLLFVANEAYGACTVTATGVAFGNYDTFATAALDTTGTITISCDTVPPIDVIISISASSNSGIFNPRQMKHSAGPDLLTYNLYTKQNRTTVWGDGTGGTSTVVVKGKKLKKGKKPKKVNVFGSIPPRQNVPAGSYSDILTVTITP